MAQSQFASDFPFHGSPGVDQIQQIEKALLQHQLQDWWHARTARVELCQRIRKSMFKTELIDVSVDRMIQGIGEGPAGLVVFVREFWRHWQGFEGHGENTLESSVSMVLLFGIVAEK